MLITFPLPGFILKRMRAVQAQYMRKVWSRYIDTLPQVLLNPLSDGCSCPEHHRKLVGSLLIILLIVPYVPYSAECPPHGQTFWMGTQSSQ